MSTFSKSLKQSLWHISLSGAALTLLASSCIPSYSYIAYVNDPMLTSINIIDRNGLSETINNPERLDRYATVDFLQPQPYQKVLRIYSRDSQGNIPACITSYHPNGYPCQYLEVINGRAFGIYKEWHANGVLKICANVIEGVGDIAAGTENTWLFDGCCQVWDEDGGLQATFMYVKGVLEGISTQYHPNGNIWKSTPFCANKIEGVVEIFRDDGTLLQSCCYQQGVKEGELKRFWCEGVLAAEESYCEGLLSYGRYYNQLGECIASVDEGTGTRAVFNKETISELQEFRDGLLEGEIKVLDKYGRVTRIYHVKNGCKHGEEIYYYDLVRLKQRIVPKLSISWYEGKIQGLVKTWYDTGVQESQKEMSNNKKNGHSTAWYFDGSLMMIEEYELDRLVRGKYFAIGERIPTSEIIDGNGMATIFDGDGNFVRKIDYLNGKPLLEECP